ncbi:MarR family winged helix-turn-helix transcriptional regulator [Nocardiopsis sediminis]|uniref:MarR family winged helix-turn-helix transcriptional regulator n=1 Tax=Nocardiopsis sediminis TaxID=1778267 RepID=A0ABV8FRD5_9ACTN
MDRAAPEQIHSLLMDAVRATGLLQPDQAVPGTSLSLSQSFALHELDSGDALSQRELAARLRLEKSTVSRMVAELERRGLLVRERDPANRRFFLLRLTDEGRALHRGMAADLRGRFARWVAGMDPAERDGLLVGLPALVRVIRAGAAGAGAPGDRDATA